ncbi:MAG: HEAT repeat domain-containing protein [Planctomycetes bacterium]|nr:HEAT repeat domain-containing protein [Planctomycetota bacterium]
MNALLAQIGFHIGDGMAAERPPRRANPSATNSAPLPALSQPIPGLVALEARWCEPLLQQLRSRDARAQWWPVLQALLGLGESAALAAVVELTEHATATDAGVRAAALELLLAVRCHFAAVAVADFDALLDLPEPYRQRELGRAVLAWAPPLDERARGAARGPARCLVQFARSGTVFERRLAAVSAALVACDEPSSTLQDCELLAVLAEVADDELTRRAARTALAATDATVAGWLTKPWSELASDWQLSELARLSRTQLQRLPPERLRELVGMLPPSASATNAPVGTAAQLLAAVRTAPGGHAHAHAARSALLGILPKVPEVLSTLSESERATAMSLFSTQTGVPAALYAPMLDALVPKPDTERMPPPLPIELAPTLLGRLRDGERMEHTIQVLYGQRMNLWWAEAIDAEADAIAGSAGRVPPAESQRFAELFSWGHRCRRASERMLLDPATPTGIRKRLRECLPGNMEPFPPAGAFVLAALRSPDAELKRAAVWVAGHAADMRPEIAALLREELPQAEIKAQRAIVRALGRLGVPAEDSLLRGWLRGSAAELRRDAVVALLETRPDDAEALGYLRAAMVASDDDERRQAWSWIGGSPALSLRFLDDAEHQLADAAGGQEHWRLIRIAQSAATIDRERAVAVLVRLTRHGNEDLARMATGVLQELRR